MKLKLNRDELNVLIHAMEGGPMIRFSSPFAGKLTTCIMRDFLTRLMKKSIDLQEKTSIELDDQTLLSLDYVLPKLPISDPYEMAIMSKITTKINQECLNI